MDFPTRTPASAIAGHRSNYQVARQFLQRHRGWQSNVLRFKSKEQNPLLSAHLHYHVTAPLDSQPFHNVSYNAGLDRRYNAIDDQETAQFVKSTFDNAPMTITATYPTSD